MLLTCAKFYFDWTNDACKFIKTNVRPIMAIKKGYKHLG